MSRKNRGNDQGFVVVSHPFSQIPHDQLVKGLIEAGKSFQEQFPDQLSKTIRVIRSVDPLQVIATLAIYGLTIGLSDSGKTKSLKSIKRFNQSHVELVQAIALHTPKDMISQAPALPSVIQELFDTLPELGDAFSLRRIAVMEKERSEDEKALTLLQEHLRLHTQNVRNWGYFKRVVALTKRLCKPADPIFHQQIGLTATKLIDIFEFLLRRLEQSATLRAERFGEIFAGKTPEDIIRNYYNLTPGLKDNVEDFVDYAKKENFSLEQVKSMVFSHSDLTLADD